MSRREALMQWSAVCSVVPDDYLLMSAMPSDIVYRSSAGGYFDRSWYGDPQPVAIRVGFVQCEYCATSQKRPDNGKCCSCGGPTPHTEGAA